MLSLAVLWILNLGGVESSKPLILQVKTREIQVNGKRSQVYEVAQPNGLPGLSLKKGERFHVLVENELDSPTGVHWHGLILPNNQDGVPYITQLPIQPGKSYSYDFLLIQAGTFWMHSHYGLQEQKLLAAPLILHDPEDRSNRQEVVMFLSDFTFQNPLDIFKKLRSNALENMPDRDSKRQMPIEGKNKGMSKDETHSMHSEINMTTDLNDVKYDAFLTNWRTLSDPDIIRVTPDQEVRLRVINGSSSTNFFVDLGRLKGEVMATDGAATLPFHGSRFEIAVAQRLDIIVHIPQGKGVYPLIAQGEGLTLQTGLILATAGMTIPSFKEHADQQADALSYFQEIYLQSKQPLSQKKIDRTLVLVLGGNMAKYIWTLNGKAWPHHEPLMVKQGERVELIFVNQTSMSHPMHLHGHVFQIKEINQKPIEGPMRDTVLVLPYATVKVQFDANNPGRWPLHCHNLYHLYAGMETTLNYEGFQGADFN